MASRNRDALALTGVVLLTVLLYGRIDHTISPYDSWDLAAYLRMAEAAPGFADDVRLPYASRLLGPMLAGLGPLAEPAMFRLLTLATALVLPWVFYRFLTARGLDPGAALTAVVLFVLNKQFFGFNVWNHFQLNDLLAMLMLVLLVDAMIRSRWLRFGAVLLLGALTRETTMLALPAAVVYLADQKRLRSEGAALLAAATPGVVLLVFLKLAMPARDFTLLEAFRHYSVKAVAWRTWFYLFVNSVAPLTFLPLVYFRRTAAFFGARRFALLFVLLVSVSAFFGSNNERLMAPVFLVFYWLIGTIFQTEITGARARWFLVGCGLLAAFHQNYTRFGFISKPAAVALTLGGLLLATLFSIMFFLRSRGRAG